MKQLADNVTRTARNHPDPPAVKLHDMVLEGYTYPHTVWIVDELLKVPTGEVLRREVESLEGSGS